MIITTKSRAKYSTVFDGLHYAPTWPLPNDNPTLFTYSTTHYLQTLSLHQEQLPSYLGPDN